MSTGDFEAQVRQSVADHLALIRTAATAAKGRIVQSVEVLRETPAVVHPAPAPASARAPRAAVDFSADEPAFAQEQSFAHAPTFQEADPFAAELASSLPKGAVSFDDFAIENVDDEGIPVWEDAP